MTQYDVVIVGAGMAGASMASELVSHCSVLLLEAEEQPGYHATGRSAAFWTETYGGPLIQPLTTASRNFLDEPNPDFSVGSFLKRRGALNIAMEDQKHLTDKFLSEFVGSGVAMEKWDVKRIATEVPNLKSNWTSAVYEPDCCDIDVGALHQAYLRNAKKHGVILQSRARVEAIDWQDRCWSIKTTHDEYRAKRLINAAGAWADDLAQLAGVPPINIEPMRRTMVQLQTDPPPNPDDALIVALDGSFYFKPEAGDSYWLSPHDETPSPPLDAAPEDLDVAVAIDRFEQVLDVKVKGVTRKWAGLRSFAPDRLPVYGPDPGNENFFWFVGQGGFGIQTAPAAARLSKALFLDEEPDAMVRTIEAALYRPDRLR